MSMDEEWRVIVEFPEYDVSSLGRVRRNCPDRYGRNSNRVIKARPHSGGGSIVNLTNDDGKRTRYVSRLVCIAFNGPSANKLARSADGDRFNHGISNIAWGESPRGTEITTAKVDENIVMEIRQSSSGITELAEFYGVSEQLVRRIRGRLTWRHVA